MAGEKQFLCMRRYRLIWENVVYEHGELRVVAYDADGRPAA